MSTVILGPGSSIPYGTFPTVVQTKHHWSDSWTTQPGLVLERATHNAGGNDLDSATFVWRYGMVRVPEDADYDPTLRSPLAIAGYWIRVTQVISGTTNVIWLGRIYGEGRMITGVRAGNPTGLQRWQAYGPQMILRKMMITQSVWVKPSGAVITGNNVLDWSAPMNDRVGQQALVIGNRSASQVTPQGSSQQSYVFGGIATWSAQDFLNYILVWWLDFSTDSPAGPKFVLGGQASLLANLQFAQEWPDVTTADHMLRTLINPRFGLDFSVEPSEDGSGFTINVFSLQASDVTAAGVTISANPNTVQVQAGQTPANLMTHVVTSDEHKVGLIRVLGKRIVVACTLEGPDCDILTSYGATIGPAWDSTEESDYDAGTGAAPSDTVGLQLFPAGSAERADLVRRSPRFRDVYQLWLMPQSIDLQGILAAIMVTNAAGDVSTGTTGSNEPPRQMVFRKTLHWIPFRFDYDYSTWPPTQLTLDTDPDYAPQYLPPQVYLTDGEQWRLATMAGVHVQLPRHGLGVRMVSHPRHLLGLGEFPNDALTLHLPKWHGGSIVATLAFESDARIALEYNVSGAETVDGTEEIYVSDAEMWVAAPSTIVGFQPSGGSGTFTTTPNTGLTILRDDRPRLAMILAGAIARYAQSRCRAEVVASGILPWGTLGGYMLSTIESGDSLTINAPITQIIWSNEADLPKTTIRAGHVSQ